MYMCALTHVVLGKSAAQQLTWYLSFEGLSKGGKGRGSQHSSMKHQARAGPVPCGAGRCRSCVKPLRSGLLAKWWR